MTGLALLGLAGGLGLTTLLVLWFGAGSIWNSASMLGLNGLAVIVTFHLLLIGLMGTAWWLLGRRQAGARLPKFMWGRLIRDSAAETLPLSQIGGYVLGARALALTGLAGGFAAASTVVDVTVELVAQLVYTVLGLALIDWLLPQNSFAAPVLVGVLGMSAAVAVFVTVQARGAGFVERFGVRLAREFLGRALAGAGTVQDGIRALHRRRGTLLAAAGIHLASWVLSGVETWITLRLMQVPIPLAPALAIDSLLYGMRSLAFLVPNALGVQEGGLILLGGLFGVTPDTAIALSLIKRARDLVIGVPALLAWQAAEGRRAWRANLLPTPASPPPRPR